MSHINDSLVESVEVVVLAEPNILIERFLQELVAKEDRFCVKKVPMVYRPLKVFSSLFSRPILVLIGTTGSAFASMDRCMLRITVFV